MTDDTTSQEGHGRPAQYCLLSTPKAFLWVESLKTQCRCEGLAFLEYRAPLH
jgi:hypothetical protein